MQNLTYIIAGGAIMVQIKEQEYVHMASSPEQCPNCGNVGYWVEEEIGNGSMEYYQVQCEFCYTNENSIFNYNKMIKRLKGDHLK